MTSYKIKTYERNNVKGKLWRKLVDMSLLNSKSLTIPTWVCERWGISKGFKNISSQLDIKSNVSIEFNGYIYPCNITWEDRTKHKRKPLYRLWLTEELQDDLKDAFIMSYVRSLEKKIRKKLSKDDKNLKTGDVLNDIPFNEFLDIEYISKRNIIMTAHYTQKPIFEFLFKSLTRSHLLHKIEKSLDQASIGTIFKSQWHKKSYLNSIGESPKNVIYHLVDTAGKKYYIGEASDLTNRLSVRRSEIPNWNYFRYDVLPESYTDSDRLQIERMVIKDFSALLKKSDKSINSCPFTFSDYKLTNKRIDS